MTDGPQSSDRCYLLFPPLSFPVIESPEPSSSTLAFAPGSHPTHHGNLLEIIRPIDPDVLQLGEVLKVQRPVLFAVKRLHPTNDNK